MTNIIYLGKYEGEKLYITKHSWDCGWYWSFGYIGNKKLHTHFDYTFMKDGIVTADKFQACNFSDGAWWTILDLFKQAYALREASAVYRHGGYITINPTTLRFVDKEMEDKLNKDCERILDTVWDFMETHQKHKTVVR